jgi:hypothetical protein
VSDFLVWLGATVVFFGVFVLGSQVSGWLAGFLVVWFFLFVLGLWGDEDANHWDWPEDKEGPATTVTLRIAGVTMLIAGLPCGLGWWLSSR